MIKDNSTILFQGDSITAGGRGRDNNNLGKGYVKKIKQYIDTFCANRNITVLNRGIAGDGIRDMADRWQTECIDLKPDYLSILIGINDVWQRYENDTVLPADEFEQIYRRLIVDAMKETKCQVILLEPFVIPTDPKKEIWYEDLTWKIQAIRKIAREYCIPIIPLDGIFAANGIGSDPVLWSEDGVHPTDAGHALIADVWLNTIL